MRILFVGELYPNIVHGVSISNRLCINALSSRHVVDIVEENTEVQNIGSFSYGKLKKIAAQAKDIFTISRKEDYDAFYTVLPVSRFGLLKTLVMMRSFYQKSERKVFAHLYRDDLITFLDRSMINRFLFKYCIRKISCLIVMSNMQKLTLARHFPDLNISIVPNSVLEEPCFGAMAVQPHQKNRFIFISNYFREKGIFELISAGRQRCDINVDCFGAFRNNKEEINRNLPSNIRINGPIVSSRKFVELASSKALILPSWNEGAPIILLEAMMIGTPILATRVGLISDMLGEKYPFLFEKKNSEDLLRCIDEFNNHIDIDEISRYLKSRYYENFSNDSNRMAILNTFGPRCSGPGCNKSDRR